MAKKTILILGRKGINVSNAEAKINDPEITVFTGTNIDDVKQTFAELKKQDKTIDHVFMGAGIEIEKRLQIMKEIFESSDSTTVHLKDRTTGAQGMLPFVEATLDGLKGYEMKNVLFENRG